MSTPYMSQSRRRMEQLNRRHRIIAALRNGGRHEAIALEENVSKKWVREIAVQDDLFVRRRGYEKRSPVKLVWGLQ